LSRRDFLKDEFGLGHRRRGVAVVLRSAHGASRDRVTIFHSSVADSIHPYNHSSSPIYGQWQHVIEPLFEYDFKRKDYVGVSRRVVAVPRHKWVFKLRKGVKFPRWHAIHLQRRAFSVERMRDEKGGSLQAPNFQRHRRNSDAR
jgi:hypothetical protein